MPQKSETQKTKKRPRPTIKRKKAKEEIKEETKKKPPKYWEGVGRRKTAIARVRIFKDGEKNLLVNDKEYQVYFQLPELAQVVISPLKKFELLDKIGVSVKVRGGGISAQAEAARHGLSRALLKFNEKYRPKLRHLGYLTRDPRMRERKKFGLKRARRAPQWQKR